MDSRQSTYLPNILSTSHTRTRPGPVGRPHPTAVAGSGNRRKAAAVGRILHKIVCHFDHRMAGTQHRSILVGVDFEPLMGDTETVEVDAPLRRENQQGRGVHGEGLMAKVLCHTFLAGEIDAAKQSLGQVKDLSHSAQAKLPEILRLRQEGPWSRSVVSWSCITRPWHGLWPRQTGRALILV